MLESRTRYWDKFTTTHLERKKRNDIGNTFSFEGKLMANHLATSNYRFCNAIDYLDLWQTFRKLGLFRHCPTQKG